MECVTGVSSTQWAEPLGGIPRAFLRGLSATTAEKDRRDVAEDFMSHDR